eukprot:UN01962
MVIFARSSSDRARIGSFGSSWPNSVRSSSTSAPSDWSKKTRMTCKMNSKIELLLESLSKISVIPWYNLTPSKLKVNSAKSVPACLHRTAKPLASELVHTQCSFVACISTSVTL